MPIGSDSYLIRTFRLPRHLCKLLILKVKKMRKSEFFCRKLVENDVSDLYSLAYENPKSVDIVKSGNCRAEHPDSGYGSANICT